MKNYIIITLLFIGSVGYAQDTLTHYFDANWKKIGQEKAVYYRKLVKEAKKTWKVSDYFLDGQLQMSGVFTSKRAKKKNGHFVYYYPNGQKSSEANYIKNKYIGKYTSWYKNGNLEKEGCYNEDNIVNGEWKWWRENGAIFKKGNFTNHNYEGEWTWYHENGEASSVEIYKADTLFSFRHFDEEGNELFGDLKAQKEPEFNGGIEMMYAYLVENIVYPEQARLIGKKGTVYIKFIIEKDGSVSHVKVIKSVYPLLDKEAKRVVDKMPKWEPAKQHNLIVRTMFTLPIKFILER